MDTTPPASDLEIAQAIQQLITWYDWQAVSAARAAARVAAWIAEGAPLGERYALQRICERATAEQLYEACEHGALRTATAAEQARWQQAYQDLETYLTAVAHRLPRLPAPNVSWDSVVQDTLIAIHADYAACADPPAFLAWAVGILNRMRLNTWRAWRQDADHQQPLDEHDDVPPPGGLGSSGLSTGDPATDRHVDPEGDKEFFTILRECLRSDSERLVALGVMAGLKRREMLTIFASIQGQFDNARRAFLARMRECQRFQRFYDPARTLPAVCVAVGCPLHGRRPRGL